MPCRIMILEESSSSSGIGVGQACYPAKLFRILQDVTDVEIVNSAVPGFIPGCQPLHCREKEFAALRRCHPLYLGNNEGSGRRAERPLQPAQARLKAICRSRRRGNFARYFHRRRSFSTIRSPLQS